MELKYKKKSLSGGGGGQDYTAGDGIAINDSIISVTHPNVPITQAEYDALSQEEKTNGSIYIITDQETPSANSGEIYSLEETRVGTWIDGKPIYRRVFKDTIDANSVIAEMPYVQEIVYFGGTITLSGATTTIPYWIGSSKKALFVYESNQLKLMTTGISAYTFTAVVEYTKTTDSPGEVS